MNDPIPPNPSDEYNNDEDVEMNYSSETEETFQNDINIKKKRKHDMLLQQTHDNIKNKVPHLHPTSNTDSTQKQLDNLNNLPLNTIQKDKSNNSSQRIGLPKVTEYTNDIPPPYKVILQPKNRDDSVKVLNPILVASKIVPHFPDHTFDDIKPSGRNKFIFITHQKKAANLLLKGDLDFIKKNNLETIIPNSYVFKYGIIKGIPEELSEEEIMKRIDIPVHYRGIQVAKVRRFSRMDENTKELVPIQTVQLIFKGNILPQYIYLYSMQKEVELYIPKTKLCTKDCYRFGHVKSGCKSKKPRCLHCGNAHTTVSCNDPKKDLLQCINCNNQGHLATHKNCPTRQFEQKVLSISIRKGKSIQEVKAEFRAIEQSRFNMSNFPELHDSIAYDELRHNNNNKNYSNSLTHNKPSISSRLTTQRNSPSTQNTQNTSLRHTQSIRPSSPYSPEHQQMLIAPNGNYQLDIKATPKPNNPDQHPYAPQEPLNIVPGNGSYTINNSILTHEQCAELVTKLLNDPQITKHAQLTIIDNALINSLQSPQYSNPSTPSSYTQDSQQANNFDLSQPTNSQQPPIQTEQLTTN